MRDAAALAAELYRVVSEEGVEGLLARYDELFADDFEWHPALVGTVEGRRRYRGREEFAEYWRDFNGVFPEIGYENESFEPEGPDQVLVTLDLHLRSAGGGVPMERETAYVFEARDGKLTAGWTFLSRRDAEEHLLHA